MDYAAPTIFHCDVRQGLNQEDGVCNGIPLFRTRSRATDELQYKNKKHGILQ